jgi:hypothetical protein
MEMDPNPSHLNQFISLLRLPSTFWHHPKPLLLLPLQSSSSATAVAATALSLLSPTFAIPF